MTEEILHKVFSYKNLFRKNFGSQYEINKDHRQLKHIKCRSFLVDGRDKCTILYMEIAEHEDKEYIRIIQNDDSIFSVVLSILNNEQNMILADRQFEIYPQLDFSAMSENFKGLFKKIDFSKIDSLKIPDYLSKLRDD